MFFVLPPHHPNPSKKSQANTYTLLFFSRGIFIVWWGIISAEVDSLLASSTRYFRAAPMGLTGNWGARKPRMDGGREMRLGWMFGRYTRNGGYLYLLLWLRAANCNGEQKKMSGRCGRTNHWTMLPLDGGGLNIFVLHHHLEKITSIYLVNDMFFTNGLKPSTTVPMSCFFKQVPLLDSIQLWKKT